jgi:glycosyltransferase involved in cell wall biosynthesis
VIFLNDLVSVIMACHNDEMYIEKSINSILSQTYKNIELIVVDDSSTDNTLSILNKFKSKDSRIIIVKNRANQGLTKSLNKVIKLVKGKYIARHDADDYSDTNRIMSQLKYMKRTSSQIVGTFCYLVNDIDKVFLLKNKPVNSRKINKQLMLRNCIIHGSTIIDFDSVGGDFYYDERYTYSQDYELWSRLSLKYKITNLAEPLYYLRVHSKSITSTKAFDQLKFARNIAIRNFKSAKYLRFVSIPVVYSYYGTQFIKIYIRLLSIYFVRQR